MVSSPRISICPAGFRINRDYASEAGLQDLVQEQGMKLCGSKRFTQSNGSKKERFHELGMQFVERALTAGNTTM